MSKQHQPWRNTVAYVRVRVVDLVRGREADKKLGREAEPDEMVVVCIDKAGNTMTDERGMDRYFYLRPECLIPANVAAAERKAS